jgi:hypothetical protein
MKHSSQYIEYLQSDTWKERRLAALERANFQCHVCGDNSGLEVHHKTYKNLGLEEPVDLVVLCSGHHWMADKERQDPGFIERNMSSVREMHEYPKCNESMLISAKINNLLVRLEMKHYLNSKDKKALIDYQHSLRKHKETCNSCKRR